MLVLFSQYVCDRSELVHGLVMSSPSIFSAAVTKALGQEYVRRRLGSPQSSSSLLAGFLHDNVRDLLPNSSVHVLADLIERSGVDEISNGSAK